MSRRRRGTAGGHDDLVDLDRLPPSHERIVAGAAVDVALAGVLDVGRDTGSTDAPVSTVMPVLANARPRSSLANGSCAGRAAASPRSIW